MGKKKVDETELDNEMPTDYEVGYGRPPKNTQFRRGVSGNPKGRPRKPVDFGQQFLREARLPVVINENGRTTRIAKYDAALRQLTHKAIKGDVNAMKLFFRYYHEASEQASLLAAQQARDAENLMAKPAQELTNEEPAWLTAQLYEEEKLKEKQRLEKEVKERNIVITE
jgi:hypothetical protein